jgi:hypothetical protein
MFSVDYENLPLPKHQLFCDETGKFDLGIILAI